jgi:methyl-accepting chemotaxis protein PixJ
MTQTPSESISTEAVDNPVVLLKPTQGNEPTQGNGQLPASKPVDRLSDRRLPAPTNRFVLSQPTAKAQSLQTGVTTIFKPSAWQRLSIRAKATALAVTFATVPVLGVGALTYYVVNRAMTEQVYSSKQRNAIQLADQTNAYISDRFSDVQVLGQLPILRDAALFDTISQEQKESLLNRYIELYQSYDSIALFDLNGDVLAQSKGAKVANHLTRDYFQRVVQTGKPTINPPSLSRTTNQLSLHFASPVKDSQTDDLKGIVRFQMSVESLNKILLEKLTKIDSEGVNRYYLIDSNGKYFVASGDKDRIGKLAIEHFNKYAQLQTAQNVQSVLDVDPDDRSQQLLTYVPLKDLAGISGLNFGVLIVSNVNMTFAPQRQLLLTLLMGTVVTALVVGAIAVVIANRATRPILAAADAVGKIGEGDLNTRLDLVGTDEIASLANNINQMASQLGLLVQEQSNATDRAKLLADVANSRASELTMLFDQFTDLLEVVRATLHADRVMLYYFTAAEQGTIVAEAVLPDRPLALYSDLEAFIFPTELRQACQQDLCLAISNVAIADLPDAYRQQLKQLNVTSHLIAPIISDDQIRGLVIVDRGVNAAAWQLTEIEFAKQLAAQMGLVVDRITLLKQTQTQAEEQRQLKESLQRRALELLTEVDPISKGDLTTQARVTADEIGTIADSYNATVDNLRQIVVQVQEATQQVVSTTSSNEMSVQTLAAEALRQANEVALALQQIEQMAAAGRAVALSAEQAEVVVQQAAQTVEAGDAAMNRTVDGIQSIRDTVAETAKKVKHLGESSQKISTVVELISTFAAQTNMLALNASIEASRAGEDGRGFAVVASEVRALAKRSAEATEEIRKLIVGIQSETNEVVATMEAGTEQVVMGTQLVDEARQSLNKITAVSTQISRLVESISQATVVQSQASDAVSQTMQDVAAIASKTSTEANQVSASFEELRHVAQSLQSSVDQFKVN